MADKQSLADRLRSSKLFRNTAYASIMASAIGLSQPAKADDSEHKAQMKTKAAQVMSQLKKHGIHNRLEASEYVSKIMLAITLDPKDSEMFKGDYHRRVIDGYEAILLRKPVEAILITSPDGTVWTDNRTAVQGRTYGVIDGIVGNGENWIGVAESMRYSFQGRNVSDAKEKQLQTDEKDQARQDERYGKILDAVIAGLNKLDSTKIPSNESSLTEKVRYLVSLTGSNGWEVVDESKRPMSVLPISDGTVTYLLALAGKDLSIWRTDGKDYRILGDWENNGYGSADNGVKDLSTGQEMNRNELNEIFPKDVNGILNILRRR